MRSVGMHGNKLILVIFSSNILQNPQGMGTFFISDFLQIMGHPSGVCRLGGPILKKCFQNFPPDPYITLYICKTENP